EDKKEREELETLRELDRQQQLTERAERKKALLEQDRLRRHQVELLRCEEIHVEFRPDLDRMKEQMEEEKFRNKKLLDAETESLVLFLRRQEEKERREKTEGKSGGSREEQQVGKERDRAEGKREIKERRSPDERA
ncbi:hypothetical protein NFI96_008487, partial [Prochilodus magdalenae]